MREQSHNEQRPSLLLRHSPDTFLNRIPRPLVAIVGPPLLGTIFIPVFQAIQEIGRPKGTLEGVDLTSFAERDALVIKVFAIALLVFAIFVAATARTWPGRVAYLFVTSLAGLVTMVIVLVNLMAA